MASEAGDRLVEMGRNLTAKEEEEERGLQICLYLN